jgi:hypothetical protein
MTEVRDGGRLRLSNYDSGLLGPLFAVSDEGSAGQAVLNAAYASAKARAHGAIDPMSLGVILDGERMTSAGEVPIGPDEYRALTSVAAGKLLLTTNVGVRVNARLSQPLPEVGLTDGAETNALWLEDVYARFAPFLDTPDGRPRPLTVRLAVRPGASLTSLKSAVAKLESARAQGKVGPRDLHRLSVLVAFEERIQTDDQVRAIKQVILAAADAGVPEVAIDGALQEAARLRISVQSLLNVLDVPRLRELLREARARGVRLTYRYPIDVESAARTVWTGLHAAQAHGFAAGKYGLVPMTLTEQSHAVALISQWMREWTAIPAFYVDTPLVTDDDVLDASRCVDAALTWLKMVHDAGVTLVLFDCPDRITPRKLLRQAGASNDPGLLTLDDVDAILAQARTLGIAILWSGGITSRQAFELAKRRVHGIFSTSSTAARIAVSPPFAGDPRLAAENEPTEVGVRRVHGLVQGGFLSTALNGQDAALAASIGKLSEGLLAAEKDAAAATRALGELDAALLSGWQRLGPAPRGTRPDGSSNRAVPVPANAVRVFRGKRRSSLPADRFLQQLGTVFMPLTVQMQRLYGLTAYLPAVLPVEHPPGLPDEIALVFYRTQAAYHDAKQCVGGRAYSVLHDLVFDMEASVSQFPAPLAEAIEFDHAYHLFPAAVDWQLGVVQLYVGTCVATLTADAFRREVGKRARQLQQSPAGIDAAILCVAQGWLICWAHASGEALAPIAVFDDVTAKVFAAEPRRLSVAHDLTVAYPGFQLSSGGEFVSLLFPRV